MAAEGKHVFSEANSHSLLHSELRPRVRDIEMPELSHSPPVQSQSVLTRVRAEFNSHRASLTLLVIFLLTAWLAFSWFETIHRILRYYNPLPTWDYWRVAESIQSYESFDFRILWRHTTNIASSFLKSSLPPICFCCMGVNFCPLHLVFSAMSRPGSYWPGRFGRKVPSFRSFELSAFC